MASAPAFAQVSANYAAGGTMRIGTTNAACTASLEGSIRWSSSQNTIELCDGQGSWRLIVSAGSSGVTPTPPAQPGYFVLSKNTYDGLRGGTGGLRDLCLQILQDEDWMGKADATARGLINATHIKPWICYNSAICEDFASGATYKFAVAGSPAVGGGSFTVGADSVTMDTQNWSGATQFGGTYTYWTGRDSAGTATVPGPGAYSPCSNWTANDDIWSVSSGIGTSNSNNGGRWYTARPSCINTHRFICVVHP